MSARDEVRDRKMDKKMAKEMAQEASITEGAGIPDKLYFRIGEVARLAGIKPYVLRFWETEFPALGPKKSGKGHRLFRRKDVELVLEIKRLLYEKRYTIEGARKFLESPARPAPARSAAKHARPAKTQGQLFDNRSPTDLSPLLAMLQHELRAIADMLK